MRQSALTCHHCGGSMLEEIQAMLAAQRKEKQWPQIVLNLCYRVLFLNSRLSYIFIYCISELLRPILDETKTFVTVNNYNDIEQ